MRHYEVSPVYVWWKRACLCLSKCKSETCCWLLLLKLDMFVSILSVHLWLDAPNCSVCIFNIWHFCGKSCSTWLNSCSNSTTHIKVLIVLLSRLCLFVTLCYQALCISNMHNSWDAKHSLYIHIVKWHVCIFCWRETVYNILVLLILHVVLLLSSSAGEIDRCLKKVAEGVEQFEDIWQKVNKDCC